MLPPKGAAPAEPETSAEVAAQASQCHVEPQTLPVRQVSISGVAPHPRPLCILQRNGESVQ